MRVVDTLSFLLGTWTLERSLTDHRAGTHGRFGGSAAFAGAPSGQNAADGGRAHYDEMGTFGFGLHTGPAFRSLEYVRLESTIVMLYFTDGEASVLPPESVPVAILRPAKWAAHRRDPASGGSACGKVETAASRGICRRTYE